VACPSVPRMACVAHGPLSHLLLSLSALWCGMVWDGSAPQPLCHHCHLPFVAKAGERHGLCIPCNTARKHHELPTAAAPAPTAPSPPQPLFDRPEGCIDQLTIEQRASILTLWKLDMSRQEIARRIPCHLNTVGHWIRRWESERSLQDAERCGRPRCTDEATDEAIEVLADEKKFVVPKQIRNELQLDFSARSVRRRLDEVGLYGRVSQTEYVFDERDIQRRLSFAEGYASWTAADWARVIFSDETHIEVYGRSRVWVQRPRGAAFDPQYLSQRMPHSERVSLWGCFCARGVGQAEIFVDEFDAVRYVDILQHNLLQTALHFYPNEGWWFQQDNAPQHTSKLASRWFHNHGVSLIDFPPYSPDLNPIENLWSIVKARVEKRLARTTDEVERVLKEEWEALDQDLLASLAASMPKRCAAVVANKGHKAPY
jgi:transposase